MGKKRKLLLRDLSVRFSIENNAHPCNDSEYHSCSILLHETLRILYVLKRTSYTPGGCQINIRFVYTFSILYNFFSSNDRATSSLEFCLMLNPRLSQSPPNIYRIPARSIVFFFLSVPIYFPLGRHPE